MTLAGVRRPPFFLVRSRIYFLLKNIVSVFSKKKATRSLRVSEALTFVAF